MQGDDAWDYGEQHAGEGLVLADADRGLGLLKSGDGPPLNYEAQVRAFRKVQADQTAARLRRLTEINEQTVDLHKATTNAAAEMLILNIGWDEEAIVYEDAVYSTVAVAMLCPLFEAIFRRAFKKLRERHAVRPWELPVHSRWSMGPAQRWDCGKHAALSRPSIVDCIAELVDATGLRQHLSPSFEPILKALFQYRNTMFHNGLEWPADALAKDWPVEFFEFTSTSGKQDFFYARDEFVKRSLVLVEEVVEAFGKYARLSMQG